MVIAASDSSDGELPGNINKLYLKALSAKEVNNFDYAVSLLEAVLKRRPDFEEASLLLDELLQIQNEN